MKKLMAVTLAVMMALGCGCAAAENTKHERVYAVTGADGTVKSITDIIRLENADGLEKLNDLTRLKEIVNAGGKETFTLDGETLVWQADGKDICYRGTSDRQPAAVPVVKLTLDGKEISAEELKNGSGEAELTVTYRSDTALPMLAVTALPLPEGMSGLQLKNAAVLTELGRRVLIGWAVPGADEAMQLPASFSVKFQADHADLQWMMTIATAEPVNMVVRELDGKLNGDAGAELKEISAVLTALKNGEPLPKVTGISAEAVSKLTALNTGLAALDNSAQQVADGAKEVSDGASQLKTGLNALKEKSGELNTGARQLMAASLAAANGQIAAFEAEAGGMKLPELTAENYTEVLDGAIAKAEKVPEIRERLTALKAQLDQVNTFVNGLQAYTDGVDQAADGAALLSGGTVRLNLGASTLRTIGTSGLKTQILDAEGKLAEKLLPLVQETAPEVLRICGQAKANAGADGYDLRPDGMKTETVYILRTDFE